MCSIHYERSEECRTDTDIMTQVYIQSKVQQSLRVQRGVQNRYGYHDAGIHTIKGAECTTSAARSADSYHSTDIPNIECAEFTTAQQGVAAD